MSDAREYTTPEAWQTLQDAPQAVSCPWCKSEGVPVGNCRHAWHEHHPVSRQQRLEWRERHSLGFYETIPATCQLGTCGHETVAWEDLRAEIAAGVGPERIAWAKAELAAQLNERLNRQQPDVSEKAAAGPTNPDLAYEYERLQLDPEDRFAGIFQVDLDALVAERDQLRRDVDLLRDVNGLLMADRDQLRQQNQSMKAVKSNKAALDRLRDSDERLEDVKAAFECGEKGVTHAPPTWEQFAELDEQVVEQAQTLGRVWKALSELRDSQVGLEARTNSEDLKTAQAVAKHANGELLAARHLNLGLEALLGKVQRELLELADCFGDGSPQRARIDRILGLWPEDEEMPF